MGFFEFFSNHAESSERHQEKALRTHYYKHNYRQVKEALKNYAKSQQYPIKNEDDMHGEIFIETPSFHMIVTIIELNPRETAMEIKVQTYKVVGLNKPKKLIKTTFEALNKNLTVKGVGLHP